LVTLLQTLHTLSYVTAGRVADRLQALKDDERGASAVEYAILVGILGAIIATAVIAFGARITALFANIRLN
jgi:pilus assembly protein Flp/PilA